MGYRSRLGKEVNVAGMGTMDIWATSSCNQLVHSGPVQAQSCTYHPCDDGVQLCPFNFMAWWVNNIQFIMGSSGHIVTWRPMAKDSASTKSPVGTDIGMDRRKQCENNVKGGRNGILRQK